MGQSPQYHNHRTHGNCNYVWGAVVRVTNGKVKTENGKLCGRCMQRPYLPPPTSHPLTSNLSSSHPLIR